MRGLDFSPYRRSTVGFDRLFDFLESSRTEQDNYPPFDIEKLSDDQYRITLAVAGFRREDIDITALQNMLVITGRRASENRNKDGSFLHVGIATRAFERRFELADFVRVSSADLADGLLTISLKREIPEAMRPRRIEIGSSPAPSAARGNQPRLASQNPEQHQAA